MPDRSKTWPQNAPTPAGWIHPTTGVYYIRKRVGGELFEVSTRATSERAALKHLERFESDPANYAPVSHVADKVALTPVLIGEFLRWSAQEKKNTPAWVEKQKKALKWWARRLGPANLAKTEPRLLVEKLDAQPTGRKVRIATIKTFCSWLVKRKHILDPAQDPTRGITVPQSRPEQWTTPKAIPKEDYLAIRAKLDQKYRDALDILAGTGWHVSEVCRFAENGTIEKHPINGAAVLVCPRRKSGEPQRSQVSKDVSKAAERLRAVGDLKYKSFLDALRRACGVDPKKGVGGLEYIKPGRLRHSVATWAINSGASPAEVAAFLGHSPATMKRFYATHAVPTKVPTLA